MKSDLHKMKKKKTNNNLIYTSTPIRSIAVHSDLIMFVWALVALFTGDSFNTGTLTSSKVTLRADRAKFIAVTGYAFVATSRFEITRLNRKHCNTHNFITTMIIVRRLERREMTEKLLPDTIRLMEVYLRQTYM